MSIVVTEENSCLADLFARLGKAEREAAGTVRALDQARADAKELREALDDLDAALAGTEDK